MADMNSDRLAKILSKSGNDGRSCASPAQHRRITSYIEVLQPAGR